MKSIIHSPSSRYLMLIFCIVFLGTILRFMHVPDRYLFDGDSIRDAIIAYEGARTLSFPLTGPFSSTGPYTFGPWYYIFLIIPSIVFPAPYTPWVFMGALSLVTIFLMADIGRLLSSKTLGIILAVMTAIAPTQINMALGLSNINLVPLFATLSIWITLKILKQEAHHFLWYIFLGVALGLGINMHYQMAGLLVLPLLLWFVLGWKKYSIPLLIFLGCFMTFIPLLIFNLQTNWHTLNGFNEMLIAKKRIYVPNSWKIYLFDFWISHLKFLLFSPTVINIALVITFIALFLSDLIRKKYSVGLLILVITFFINFLWLRYYWGERHDVYLYYLSPLLFIFLGFTLVALLKRTFGKILFVVFAGILGFHMLATDYTRITEASQAQAIPWKKEVQLLLGRYPNTNLILYSCKPFYESHKRTLVYFLRFHYQPGAAEKKIALKGHDCIYPPTKELVALGSTFYDKAAIAAYPFLFPELKETNFNFVDISHASPSAIQEAAWEPLTTDGIFNSTINWWKN